MVRNIFLGLAAIVILVGLSKCVFGAEIPQVRFCTGPEGGLVCWDK